MAGDPDPAYQGTQAPADPAYPPEFEALDVAFNAALNVAEGDVPRMNKLADIMDAMSTVAQMGRTKAKAYAAEREGVE